MLKEQKTQVMIFWENLLMLQPQRQKPQILSQINHRQIILFNKDNKHLEDKELLVKHSLKIAINKDRTVNLNGMENCTVQNIKENEQMFDILNY